MCKCARRSFWLTTCIGCGVLAAPLLLYAIPHLQRPARTPIERPLFQGITYAREARTLPRPLMIHRVTVDLSAPGIEVLVTPGQAPADSGVDSGVDSSADSSADSTEFSARTTSEFLQEFGLQLAVNANFFYRFMEKTPWMFYPHSGERVNVVGQAISKGQQVSPPEPDWVVLCFGAGQARIEASGTCPPGTQQAVAGSTLLISEGQASATLGSVDSDAAYSRTAVAIDATGKTLWIVAIDDKQLFYSEGVTLQELTDLLLSLGAAAAINLDGGGSTTLVAATPTGTEVLNAPIHTRIPMRERPVANHIGFYARPLSK